MQSRLDLKRTAIRCAPLLLTCACAAPRPSGEGAAPDPTPSQEAAAMPYEAAVASLLETIRAAIPPASATVRNVTLSLQETTPAKLGWRAENGGAHTARILTLMTPRGASRALGLLPLAGRYVGSASMAAAQPGGVGGTPRLIAIGPDLVVVEAPVLPVALTLEVEREDAPLLAEALSVITRWQAAEVLAPAKRPASLADPLRFVRVLRHPHFLEIELAPGATLEEARVLADVTIPFGYREAPPITGGLLPVPTVVIDAP